MKVLLSLCAVLMTLVCLCNSMDRNRNKLCYKAKVCIHTAKEKCGVDSKGNLRRFYDSCDIMEYNCLKGSDYQKTTKSRCNSLPPIDEQRIPGNEPQNDHQDATEVLNEEVADETGIKGEVTIHTDGSAEGEITINDKDPATGAHVNLDEEVPGAEGEIVIHTDGSVEGQLTIANDKDLITGANTNVQNEEPAAVEDVAAGPEEEAPTLTNDNDPIADDNTNLPNEEPGVKGEITLHTDGSVEGELTLDNDKDQITGDNTNIQNEEPGLEGEITVHTDGSVEGKLTLDLEKDQIARQNTNMTKIVKKEPAIKRESKLNKKKSTGKNALNQKRLQKVNKRTFGNSNKSNQEDHVKIEKNVSSSNIRKEPIILKSTEEVPEKSFEKLLANQMTISTDQPIRRTGNNKYWCWRSKYCVSTLPTESRVCAVDRRRKNASWFQNECDVFKHNCGSKHDFMVTVDSTCIVKAILH